jgi:hypothetical protein
MRALCVMKGLRSWAARPNLLLRASLLLFLIAAVTMLPLRLGDYAQLLALKTFTIAVLAFLPGWLFLRFVTVRACAVWDEYVLNLHRLAVDRAEHLPCPPANSLYHARWVRAGGPAHAGERNIYRDKFESHYGKGTARDQGDAGARDDAGREGAVLKVETFFPVFLATAVFAAGWTAVLGGGSLLTVASPDPAAFTTVDMLRLGFMGAYLFTLQMLIRRYFQTDLKASAYVNAITRVVSALVLVLVVDTAGLQGRSPGTRVAVAFVIGFFPLVGLQAIQKAAAMALRTVVPTLRNDYPLSDLDGLSVWYEARLLELGIEDMENLATANLVDVTLHSRVPVARLVDWVDQAHLYLHLAPKAPSRRRRRDVEDSSRQILRGLGIRTATDLEQAFSPCLEGAASTPDGLVSAEDNRILLQDLRGVLSRGGKAPSATTSILKTLRNDPNLLHVRAWKHDWTREAEVSSAPATAATNGHGNGAAPRNGHSLALH